MSQIQAVSPQLFPKFQASIQKATQFGMAIHEDVQDEFVQRKVALDEAVSPEASRTQTELDRFVTSFKTQAKTLCYDHGEGRKYVKKERGSLDPEAYVAQLARLTEQLASVQADPEHAIGGDIMTLGNQVIQRKLTGCAQSLLDRVKESANLLKPKQLLDVMKKMEEHSVVFPKSISEVFIGKAVVATRHQK